MTSIYKYIFFLLTLYFFQTSCALWEPDIDLDRHNDLIIINHSSCNLLAYYKTDNVEQWVLIGEIPSAQNPSNPTSITFKGALPKELITIYIVYFYDETARIISSKTFAISGREDITFTITRYMCP